MPIDLRNAQVHTAAHIEGAALLRRWTNCQVVRHVSETLRIRVGQPLGITVSSRSLREVFQKGCRNIYIRYQYILLQHNTDPHND